MTENARVADRMDSAPAVIGPTRVSPALATFAAGEDRLYVHASADHAARWNYVDGISAAVRSLASSDARTVLCGHTHVPAIFYDRPAARRSTSGRWRTAGPAAWLDAAAGGGGSVGQPRDGNPAACFGLLDTGERTITMVRVPYDHDETRRKILACGLPAWLGMRLLIGR